MQSIKKPIFVYNSLHRTKEEFRSIKEHAVGMYSCGPTVYNFPHIGNYRAYLFNDLAARVFIYNGFDVTHVMNITDVDDKTIRDSKAAHQSLLEFTTKYTKAFLDDLGDLNITTITYHPKASLHIQEMIELIKKLLESDIAYQAQDSSVYFSLAAFSSYGKLSRVERDQLQTDASGRVKNDEYSKDNVQDFALWKAWDESDDDVYWDAPFGRGRPGWHIECSAMSMKYLGSHFDIHAGGIDLLFPHHENEIAQSEAATHEPFVNYWLHNEWLLVNGKKMSKSSGTFYTLRDILAKGYEPLAYRFFCLSAHYRQSLNFTLEALGAAQTGYRNLCRDVLNMVERAIGDMTSPMSDELKFSIQESRKLVHLALNDDFNTPQALAKMFEFLKYIHQQEQSLSSADFKLCLEVIYEWDEVFGFNLKELKNEILPQEIRDLTSQRDDARTAQKWNAADDLRRQIESLGYAIEDMEQGTRIKKI